MHSLRIVAVSVSILLTTVAAVLVFLLFTLLGATFIFSCGFAVIAMLTLSLMLLFPLSRQFWIRVLFGFDAVFLLLSIGYVTCVFSNLEIKP
jgi:hypothetical protein